MISYANIWDQMQEGQACNVLVSQGTSFFNHQQSSNNHLHGGIQPVSTGSNGFQPVELDLNF